MASIHFGRRVPDETGAIFAVDVAEPRPGVDPRSTKGCGEILFGFGHVVPRIRYPRNAVCSALVGALGFAGFGLGNLAYTRI